MGNILMRRKHQRGRLEKFVVIAAVLALVVVVLAITSSFQKRADAISGVDQKKFTSYDVQLAMKLLDKNLDGKSDCCGADLGEYIAQEDMELPLPDGTVMGALDKTKKKHHVHADFKVFIDGQAVDFSDPKYFVKSAFIHVEDDHKPGTGDVLHMHAENVPLWMFFESQGMTFNKDCFTMDTQQYCNQGNKKVSFYVNGQPSDAYEDYVIQDDDQILISYNDGSSVSQELNQITSYAPLYKVSA